MDILERLRDPLRRYDDDCYEAADEIERLREENATLLHSADDVYKRLMPEVERLREAINQMLDSGCNTEAYLIGTAALQQKEDE